MAATLVVAGVLAAGVSVRQPPSVMRARRLPARAWLDATWRALPDDCVIATMSDRVLTMADARRLGQAVQPAPPLQSLVRLAVDVAVADAWAVDVAVADAWATDRPRARRGDEALRSFTAEFKGAGSALEQARRLRERMVELRQERGVRFGPCYAPLDEGG